MRFSATSRKAIALIVLVFLLGIALGAVGNILVDRRVLGARVRGAQQPRPMTRLTQALDLTADQQQQLSTILKDMQQRLDAVHQQMNPQFEQIRNEGHDKIRQILTPQQRPKFEEFLQRVAEERRRRTNR